MPQNFEGQLQVFNSDDLVNSVKRLQIVQIIVISYMDASMTSQNMAFKNKSTVRSILFNLEQEIKDRRKEIIKNEGLDQVIGTDEFVKTQRRTADMTENLLKTFFRNNTSHRNPAEDLKKILKTDDIPISDVLAKAKKCVSSWRSKKASKSRLSSISTPKTARFSPQKHYYSTHKGSKASGKSVSRNVSCKWGHKRANTEHSPYTNSRKSKTRTQKS